jgi:hypothetical protein
MLALQGRKFSSYLQLFLKQDFAVEFTGRSFTGLGRSLNHSFTKENLSCHQHFAAIS